MEVLEANGDPPVDAANQEIGSDEDAERVTDAGPHAVAPVTELITDPLMMASTATRVLGHVLPADA